MGEDGANTSDNELYRKHDGGSALGVAGHNGAAAGVAARHRISRVCASRAASKRTAAACAGGKHGYRRQKATLYITEKKSENIKENSCSLYKPLENQCRKMQ